MYKVGQRVIVKAETYNGRIRNRRGFITGICDGEDEVLYNVLVLEENCTSMLYCTKEQIISVDWKGPLYNIGQKVIVNLEDDTGKVKKIKGIICYVYLSMKPKADFEYDVLIFEAEPFTTWFSEDCLTPCEWEEV